MNANLRLYAARTGTAAIPEEAHAALGDNPWSARVLVVAAHKGLAHRAAEVAGVKVNLNGWRVASPPQPHSNAPDVRLLLGSQLLHAPAPGTILLSRSYASGFVARWFAGGMRWTRVAEYVDGKLVLLPGSHNETRIDQFGCLWQIDAGAWRARRAFSNCNGPWQRLDDVLARYELWHAS